jgi:predicted DNA-binding transcriptional regulator AlpA
MNPSPLPSALAPRGLNRQQSAAYIGIGTTKFDQMVADGRMPRPKRIDGRVLWDRVALDQAFEALPTDGPADQEANPWDEQAA